MITEHLQPDQLEYELGLVEHRRDPPVPVEVRSLHPGATRDVVLYGWARNPRGAAGMWGLVTGLREYAPGFLAEFCWWTSSENIRPRP